MMDHTAHRKEYYAAMSLERGFEDMATTANICSHIDAQSKLATAAVITSALAMDK